MTARSSIPALLITLLLSIAFVVAACGDDDDEAPAADYLIQLLAFDAEFEQLGFFLAEAFEEQSPPLGSGEPRLVAVRQFSGQALELFEILLDGTKGLNATEGLEKALETRIVALETAHSAWKNVDDRLDDIESEAEMATLFEQLFTSEDFAGLSPPCFFERALGIDIGCDAVDIVDATPAAAAATPAATDATPAP